MIVWLLQQVSLVRKVVQASDTPQRMAWGFAFGVLLGLVPKGNLVAVVLSMVLLATRANLSIGMATALAFSLLSSWLDPLTHRLGLAVLTMPALQAWWQSAYQLPLVPWTSLNNTVVCGSLIVGLLAFYPAYRVSKPVFQRYLDWRVRRREQAESTALPATVPLESPEAVESSIPKAA
ncbi:MAG: TIGR03546 family protein [Pirellulaceae bacterium]|nr:TIGR03546 family protein [Pirellulaceae bacterium]